MKTAIVITAAIVAIASSCSTGSSSKRDPHTARKAPCAKFDTTRAAPDGKLGGAITVKNVAEAQFSGVVSSTALWSHYLAFSHDTKRLVVCDLNTGTTVMPTAFGDDTSSVITYVTGSHTTVVYTTFAAMPSTVGGTDWTIESRDLAGSRKHRRWAAGSSDYKNLPQPVIDWPWLVWVEAVDGERPSTDARTSKVWAADVRSGDKKEIAHGGDIGGVAVSKGSVFFDASTSDGHGRELFRVPADASAAPVQLTNQGGVRKPTAANGRVVWRNESNEGDKRYTMAATDTEPTALPITGASVPGSDFLLVAEDVTRRLGILDLGSISAELIPVPGGEDLLDPRAYWSVGDEYVSWVTVENPGVSNSGRRLHVARVTRR